MKPMYHFPPHLTYVVALPLGISNLGHGVSHNRIQNTFYNGLKRGCENKLLIHCRENGHHSGFRPI